MTKCGRIQPNERTREFLLAPDLGAWLNRRNLVVLVLDMVQKVEDSALDVEGITAGGRRTQPKAMLTLLTYCYAAGIYGSAKIVRQIEGDETLRYLCAKHPPDSAALCRFRRQNREVIEQCLQKVCLVAWKTRFGSWHRTRSDQQGEIRLNADGRIDPSLQIQILIEVKERLERAEGQDNGEVIFRDTHCPTFSQESGSEPGYDPTC